MTITDKLSSYYAKTTHLGYVPNSVGVSEEEFNEYLRALKDLAHNEGLVYMGLEDRLFYKGMELVVYGKKHTDKRLSKDD